MKSKTSASIDEQPIKPKAVNYDVGGQEGGSNFDDQPIRPKVVNYDLDTDVPFLSSTPKSKMKPKGVSSFEEHPIKPIDTDKEAPVSSKGTTAKNECLIHMCIQVYTYIYICMFIYLIYT
jgi:hypothetical protein